MHIRICMQVTKGALACICTQVSEGVLVAYEGLCMYLPSDMVSEHVRARIELMSSKEDDPDMILMAVNLLARCCSRLDGPLLHSWVLPTFRRLAECSGFQLQEVGGRRGHECVGVGVGVWGGTCVCVGGGGSLGGMLGV